MCCVSRKEGQVGKALISMPWFMVDRVLDACQAAEQKLGQPPNALEIFVQLKKMYTVPIKNPYELCAVMISLLREDRIYSNNTATAFSLQKHEGFMSFTERFGQKFGKEYGLNNDQTLKAVSAKTLNLKEMLETLKSTDPAKLEANKWMFDGEFRLLDGQKID